MTLQRTINDEKSPIEDTLEDQDGNAVDISGQNEVEIHILKPDGTTISDNTAGNVTVDDGANGQVSYEFASGDLDQEGTYYYEWEVQFSASGADAETWPSEGKGEPLIVSDEIA